MEHRRARNRHDDDLEADEARRQRGGTWPFSYTESCTHSSRWSCLCVFGRARAAHGVAEGAPMSQYSQIGSASSSESTAPGPLAVNVWSRVSAVVVAAEVVVWVMARNIGVLPWVLLAPKLARPARLGDVDVASIVGAGRLHVASGIIVEAVAVVESELGRVARPVAFAIADVFAPTGAAVRGVVIVIGLEASNVIDASRTHFVSVGFSAVRLGHNTDHQ